MADISASASSWDDSVSGPMMLLLAARILSQNSRRSQLSSGHNGRVRHKRQITEALSMLQNMKHLMTSEPKRMYDMLWSLDQQSGCALKLTCALAALPKHQAIPQDMLLLRMFGKRPFLVTNADLSQPYGIYKYAAFMGAKSMRQSTCDTLFAKCAMSSQQMIPLWRGIIQIMPSMINTFNR